MTMHEAESWNSLNSILSISFNWRPFGFHLMFYTVRIFSPMRHYFHCIGANMFAINIWFDWLILSDSTCFYVWRYLRCVCVCMKFAAQKLMLISKLWNALIKSLQNGLLLDQFFYDFSDVVSYVGQLTCDSSTGQCMWTSIDLIQWDLKLYTQNSMQQFESSHKFRLFGISCFCGLFRRYWSKINVNWFRSYWKLCELTNVCLQFMDQSSSKHQSSHLTRNVKR